MLGMLSRKDFIPNLFRNALLAFACLSSTSLFSASLSKEATEDLLKGVFVEGITIDLREPCFSEGVLTTEQGGVITGPNIRIQAQKIVYTRKVIDGKAVCTIEAEGSIMLEFGNYVFVGEKLFYDFQSSIGTLYYARSGIAPWYVGGDIINLWPDGSYSFSNAYITTSDNYDSEWYIAAEEASLRENRYIRAKNIRFFFMNLTLLRLPSLSLDLKTLTDSPVRYKIGWGGRQGPRIGLSYEIFEWNRFKTFLRLDYRLTRGLGGGFETRYTSEDHRQRFQSINYVARDSSIFHPNEKYRYRLQGVYHNELCDDKLTVDLTYDKLSDKDMAVDYADQSLDIALAGRTQLDVRRQERYWIANLMARLRINSFETVKQELPTFQLSWKPFEVGYTGIISDNRIEASYLDYAYSNNVEHVHDYSATRFSFMQKAYRPLYWGPVIITPEQGSTFIVYGNSQREDAKTVVVGILGCNINAPMYRVFDSYKHVIVPYVNYNYYTFPVTPPNDHFIFDINDGWYRLNMMRFGVNQSFYKRNTEDCVVRYLFTDLYANAFFDTRKIPKTIPKVYGRVVWNSSPTLRHVFDTAWDFLNGGVGHWNMRTEWTLSPDFAVAAEYRHRDAFEWRKADHDNYVLDFFRSVEELRHSQLSDRRDTFLLHFFYRFHPSWAIEYEARHGWNRHNRTRYTEFEVDLLTNIRSSTQVKLSYQHKESEDRIAIYFSVWPQGPEGWSDSDRVVCAEF